MEEYKSNLLKYLTGNINIENKSSTPYYLDITKTNDNTLHNYIYSRVGSYFISGSVKCKDGKGNENGKILSWGANNNSETFLLLTDENLNPLSLMTTYSSGKPIRAISDLKVDEDGNVYGLDYYQDEEDYSFKFRIVLFNNLSEIPKKYNDYTCILRASYYLQGYTIEDDLSPLYTHLIQKSKQSATYYFAVPESTGHIYMTGTLKINVGESNEWTRLADVNSSATENIKVYFDKDDIPNATYYDIYYNGNDRSIVEIYQKGENEPYSVTILPYVYPYFNGKDYNDDYFTKLVVTETNKIYMILYGLTEEDDMYKQLTRVYILEKNVPKLLFTKFSEPGNYFNLNYPKNLTLTINDKLFMYLFEQQDTSTTDSKNIIYFNMLEPNSEIDCFTNTGYTMSVIDNTTVLMESLNNQFDLYSFNIYTYTDGYSVINTKMIINDKYNGEEYENSNILKPNESILYNTNNKPIFARKIYNSKIYNNRVITTLNVPNNMLNDITIAKQNILSETNSVIASNTQNITKNIYEELYINYFLTFNMENRNENIYVSNQIGANRLTKSAFKNADYNNAKCTKIKVTYSDDSYFITGTTCTITNGVGTYEINLWIPTDKNIKQIDFISNDEETIYNTINEETISKLELVNNKVYTITQNVYIEE